MGRFKTYDEQVADHLGRIIDHVYVPYDPKLHYKRDSNITIRDPYSGMTFAHRVCMIADLSFFNNKCHDLNEDIVATRAFFEQRYAFLPPIILDSFQEYLDHYEQDTRCAIANNKARCKKYEALYEL